ncbi:hypothetical protein VTN49DRAFT_3993 [Thermomyces lanuginosus]|uniref:uncharacterized protein n=1 Tax=Thermomyces lanuginosus TaxID=5541 RepID=UPI003742B603
MSAVSPPSLKQRPLKRSRADTEYSRYDAYQEVPPPPDFAEYWGKSMEGVHEFELRFGTYFKMYSSWFSGRHAEKRKVITAVGKLEFIQWLKDQIENRESQWLEAALKYNDSRQRQGQSIASFLKYLGRWEARLDFTYAQEQRIAHLWAKVLPEIRRESMKFPSRDLQSYASFVSHLKHVECYLQMERSENEGRGGRSKSCDRVNSRPFNKRRSETREYPVLRKSKNKGITKRRK